jgi:hypothetical protein
VQYDNSEGGWYHVSKFLMRDQQGAVLEALVVMRPTYRRKLPFPDQTTSISLSIVAFSWRIQ